MKKLSVILFFLAGVSEVLSGLLRIEALHVVSKPLIMVFLGAYYFFSEVNVITVTRGVDEIQLAIPHIVR